MVKKNCVNKILLVLDKKVEVLLYFYISIFIIYIIGKCVLTSHDCFMLN